MGAAALMMKTLANEVKVNGCGRFEWVVCDWKADAQNFTKNLAQSIKQSGSPIE